jgi:hypothetical protein
MELVAAAHWRRAFDADDHALRTADGVLPHEDVASRLTALAAERRDTERLLLQLTLACGHR